MMGFTPIDQGGGAMAVLEVLGDPERYKKALADLNEQTVKAEQASAKARSDKADLDAAMVATTAAMAEMQAAKDAFNADREAATRAHDQRETRLNRLDDRLKVESARMEDDKTATLAKLDARSSELRAVESKLNQRSVELDARAAELAQQADEVEASISRADTLCAEYGAKVKAIRDFASKLAG